MKKSFTLVELMIVVAIIGVLAGIAMPKYKQYVRKSEASEGMIYMKNILEAEILYKAIHNRYFALERYGVPLLNKSLDISLPNTSKFKYFTVKICMDTLIISAISNLSFINGTVYYIYGNISDYKTDKYSKNYYFYDYINEVETPNEAPTICRAR